MNTTEKIKSDQSYWAVVRKQFKKNRIAVFASYVIAIAIFIAMFADFLANEKPIMAKYKGTIYFPVFKEYAVDLGIAKWPSALLNVDWENLQFDWAIWQIGRAHV